MDDIDRLLKGLAAFDGEPTMATIHATALEPVGAAGDGPLSTGVEEASVPQQDAREPSTGDGPSQADAPLNLHARTTSNSGSASSDGDSVGGDEEPSAPPSDAANTTAAPNDDTAAPVQEKDDIDRMLMGEGDRPHARGTKEGSPGTPAVVACAYCHESVGIYDANAKIVRVVDGLVHSKCLSAYRRTHVPRCAYCRVALPRLSPSRLSSGQEVPAGSEADDEVVVIHGSTTLHRGCVADYKNGKPYIPPSFDCVTRKFSVGKRWFSKRNWQTRYFILSPVPPSMAPTAAAAATAPVPAPASATVTGGEGGKPDSPAAATGATTAVVAGSKATYHGVGFLAYYKSKEDAERRRGNPRGTVQLDRRRARMVTKPTQAHHPYAVLPAKVRNSDSPSSGASSGPSSATRGDAPTPSNAATAHEDRTQLLLIFFDKESSSVERKLLLQFGTSAERLMWEKALCKYIELVDMPMDDVNG